MRGTEAAPSMIQDVCLPRCSFTVCLTLKKMSQKLHAAASRMKMAVDDAEHTSTIM